MKLSPLKPGVKFLTKATQSAGCQLLPLGRDLAGWAKAEQLLGIAMWGLIPMDEEGLLGLGIIINTHLLGVVHIAEWDARRVFISHMICVVL